MELDYYFYPDEYLDYDLGDLSIPVSIFFDTCDDELDDYPLPHTKNEKFKLDFGISNFNIK
ncbi:hypothetical protein THOM_1725 [Trachipleistophora hominis]|uniref:Uncharacterized protein n=1 Tax=Trachipleistophora hominis TaxID=72359 RepID=L7JV85_TRAHO|nr:hypothetical protein THOM_1725 [Trachipleistophora hominis]